MSFTPGLRLHDRFILVDRIGLGGMSEVWRATDAVLGRTVAVKVLSSPLAADPILRAATWREARAAAQLTHPNVTQVYDYGEATMPGGEVVPYLVMEFVGGQSLADRLAGGPLPWPEAVTVGAQVAAALAAAHAYGVVHRDVKPGNVMLTPTGAKVLDFGIAALAGAGSDADGGWLVGTPAYAAPERLRPGPAQAASDVYALGVLLHEMLTGRRPVAVGSWAEAEAVHRRGALGAGSVALLDLPGLPTPVARLVETSLSRDPDVRPTAEEVAVGLAAAVGQPDPTEPMPRAEAPASRPAPAGYAVGSAALPQPPTMVERDTAYAAADQPRGRSPLMLVGVLGAVAALVIGAVLVAVALRPNGTPEDGSAQPGPATGGETTSATPGPTTPSPAPAGDREAIIAEFGRIVDAAEEAGQIDEDQADELRDRLEGLESNRGRGNVRKRADDLISKINEMMEKGDIDAATGNQLITLIEPLTNGGGDD